MIISNKPCNNHEQQVEPVATHAAELWAQMMVTAIEEQATKCKKISTKKVAGIKRILKIN